MNRQLPAYGPITAEQQARMDADDREIQQRREAARFVPILERRRRDNLGDFDDEGHRGWCMFLRRPRSTWHPVICLAFKPLARERRIKVTWKGVVYG